jgi:hypothetical protein
MFKKFFAKLAWNPNRPREFQEEMAKKGQEISRSAEALVRERELVAERMKGAQAAEAERITRQSEEVNLNDQLKTEEKHDQAA